MGVQEEGMGGGRRICLAENMIIYVHVSK